MAKVDKDKLWELIEDYVGCASRKTLIELHGASPIEFNTVMLAFDVSRSAVRQFMDNMEESNG